MPTLWIKFPEEAMFYRRFDAAEKKALEAVFSTADAASPWRRALRLLGLASRPGNLIFWHEDVPYFNGSLFVQLVSGGAITAVPEGAEYRFSTRTGLRDLWALLCAQWKTSVFLARAGDGDDKIAESLALGLGLQSLMLQLGKGIDHLAGWLAAPSTVPPRYKRLVRQIQAVQVRRTALSPAWKDVFPHWQQADDAPQGLPAFFWDAPSAAVALPQKSAGDDAWPCTPVCGGQVVGRAVTDMKNRPAGGDPLILVFRQARPETTELFDNAAGLVFAEGGVLSHACTIARERNIPAVTGAGTAFYDYVQRNPGLWIALDGGASLIKVIRSDQGNEQPIRPIIEEK